MNKAMIGSVLLSAIAIFGGTGGFMADWNKTHMKNPKWPPHAKFHNAQTLSAGVLLALSTLFFTWRKSGDRRTNDLAAVLFGGNYFWTQFAAGFFPRTGWTDPEFLKAGESLDQPIQPQHKLDLTATALVLLAGWLMWPREEREDAAQLRF